MIKSSSTFRSRMSWTLVAISSFLLVGGGCNLLATAVWVWTGNEVPAKYKIPKESKVVVVCRGTSTQDYRDATAPDSIAQRIGYMLQTNLGKKINVVPHNRVTRFSDENNWSDFTEVGEGLHADIVIGVELLTFELKQGQTLRKGEASVKIRVYDMKKQGGIVYQNTMHGIKYPTMGEMPASDMRADQFRTQYLNYVAESVGRHFFAHDPTVDPARQW